MATEVSITPPETPPRLSGKKNANPGIKVTEESPESAGNSSNMAILDTNALAELNSKESLDLLDTIDALRALHVGDIVQLPQIIVVGDQSAGKSSVLEAISRVKFPTKGGLCTRFATEMILRRTDFASASVKIARSGPSRADGNADSSFERLGFDSEQLPAVIEEAKAWMGLEADGAGDFSKDVLRIEVSGPDVQPLTLVDLPGFFQSPVQGQSAQGKVLVDQLAESYMKQKNSIMLAVVSANYQVTNQRVLREVKRHDPEMKRTLGIITKPDLPHPGSDDQRQAIQLASGQDSLNQLPLGWHVLRNRSEWDDEIDGQRRDSQEEDFFRTGNWSVIPRKDRGASMLRVKLSYVLHTHIQRSLPGLIEDIEANLNRREHELNQLGKERSQPEDMRGHLVEIAVQFDRLARDAVNGHYSDEFFGDLQDPDKKLRSLLRNLNKAFGVTLLKKGAAETIIWSDDDGDDIDQDDDGYDEDAVSEENLVSQSATRGDNYLRNWLRLYRFPKPAAVSEAEINQRVEEVASVNQGREFPGSVNADLAMDFFKKQAAPWEGIARFHLKLVTDFCVKFVEQLFQHIVGEDQETLDAILRLRVDTWFQTRREVLEARLQELLRPYKAGYVVALEQEMHTRTNARTIKRLMKQAGRFINMEDATRGSGLRPVDVLRGLNSDGSPLTSQFGTEKVIDLMMAHYDMSLRTFTDNVVHLAVESCLVDTLQTILTPQDVNRLSDEELDRLAGESEEVRDARNKLKAEVGVLKDGLQKCQRYKPRQMISVPSIAEEAMPRVRRARVHPPAAQVPRPPSPEL